MHSDRTVRTPAFGDGVRVGCPNGAAHNARTLALPHRVEARSELVVAITEQVLDSDAGVTKLGVHVAGHLGNPVPGGVGRDAGEEDPARPVMGERGRRAGAARSCRPRRSRRPRCPPPAGGGTGARWESCAVVRARGRGPRAPWRSCSPPPDAREKAAHLGCAGTPKSDCPTPSPRSARRARRRSAVAQAGGEDTSSVGRRGDGASEGGFRVVRRTPTSARASRAGSALRARPGRPVGGRAAASCDPGSRARGAAPGSRSPWTRSFAGRAARARGPAERQGRRTTRARDGDDRAFPW